MPPHETLKNHARVLAGNVSFGADGTNTDQSKNIEGFWAVGVVTPATPNAAFTVAYSLPNNRVAIGFDVKRADKAASVYDSGTAWSTSTISLKCSVASVTVTLFIH